LRLFSFGGYGLALAALARKVFGAIECPPKTLFMIWAKLRNFLSAIAQRVICIIT